ncbi:MAG: hypothetical protein ACOZCO_02630 [Bacteroidota bacterium]
MKPHLFILSTFIVVISCNNKSLEKHMNENQINFDSLNSYYQSYSTNLTRNDYIMQKDTSNHFVFIKIKNVEHYSHPPMLIFDIEKNKYYKILHESIDAECFSNKFKNISIENKYSIIQDECDDLNSLIELLNTFEGREKKISLALDALSFRIKDRDTDTIEFIVSNNNLFQIKEKLIKNYNFDSTNADMLLIDSSFSLFSSQISTFSITFSKFPRIYQFSFEFNNDKITDIQKRIIRPDLFYLGSLEK